MPSVMTVGPSDGVLQPTTIQDGVDATRDAGIEAGTDPPPESVISRRAFGGAMWMLVFIVSVLSDERSRDPDYHCRYGIVGKGAEADQRN